MVTAMRSVADLFLRSRLRRAGSFLMLGKWLRLGSRVLTKPATRRALHRENEPVNSQQFELQKFLLWVASGRLLIRSRGRCQSSPKGTLPVGLGTPATP